MTDKKDHRCTDSQGDYTVYCTNMPLTVTMDDLQGLFSKYGKLIGTIKTWVDVKKYYDNKNKKKPIQIK